MPLEETFILLRNKLTQEIDQNQTKINQSLKKTLLINSLRLATQAIFIQKDKLYQQQDRVSMLGSPLVPTLTNFVSST